MGKLKYKILNDNKKIEFSKDRKKISFTLRESIYFSYYYIRGKENKLNYNACLTLKTFENNSLKCVTNNFTLNELFFCYSEIKSFLEKFDNKSVFSEIDVNGNYLVRFENSKLDNSLYDEELFVDFLVNFKKDSTVNFIRIDFSKESSSYYEYTFDNLTVDDLRTFIKGLDAFYTIMEINDKKALKKWLKNVHKKVEFKNKKPSMVFIRDCNIYASNGWEDCYLKKHSIVCELFFFKNYKIYRRRTVSITKITNKYIYVQYPNLNNRKEKIAIENIFYVNSHTDKEYGNLIKYDSLEISKYFYEEYTLLSDSIFNDFLTLKEESLFYKYKNVLVNIFGLRNNSHPFYKYSEHIGKKDEQIIDDELKENIIPKIKECVINKSKGISI